MVDLTEEDMKKVRAITKKLRICDGNSLNSHYMPFD